MKFLKAVWSSLRSSTSSWSYRPNCRRLKIHGRTQNLRWPLLFLLLLVTWTWWSASSMRFCWCWKTAILYCSRSLSGSSIFWGGSNCRHDQQLGTSVITHEGRRRCDDDNPLATRCVHAWNKLEERLARYRFVQHSFSTPIFAACSLDMR